MTTLRVLLVDDHGLFREGLGSLLRFKGVEVVGEAANGALGCELALRLRPDLVLMDLAMPEMNGLEATRRLREEMPELPVVVLTASEEDDDLFEAVKAGAQGYVLKSVDGETFVNLLQRAAKGEAALTPALAAKILTEFARLGHAGSAASEPAPASRGALDLVEPLTTREREVLELVVDGLSNRDIADRLVVSENTVKYHLRNILDKLHLQSRAQVVSFALRHGLAGGG
ncbi:MAG: response regulator transcription factor [Chloroflexi bacterium]|nr:response regulator transcription factor [Chloroflexota bacterium]